MLCTFQISEYSKSKQVSPSILGFPGPDIKTVESFDGFLLVLPKSGNYKGEQLSRNTKLEFEVVIFRRFKYNQAFSKWTSEDGGNRFFSERTFLLLMVHENCVLKNSALNHTHVCFP